MKATKLLSAQHRKVEAIFKKLEGGRTSREPLLKDLADSLAAHMLIEQQIFYPAINEIDKDMVEEAFEEHALMELSLKRLLATNTETDVFKARVTTLKELIEHHVEEEEEELFPKVEKKMAEDVLTLLGKQMKEAFEAACKRGFETVVPSTMAQTSSDVDHRKAPGKTRNGRAQARA